MTFHTSPVSPGMMRTCSRPSSFSLTKRLFVMLQGQDAAAAPAADPAAAAPPADGAAVPAVPGVPTDGFNPRKVPPSSTHSCALHHTLRNKENSVASSRCLD